MKERPILCLAICLISILTPLQAQTFDTMWKEVKQLEEKNLPQSVTKLTTKIYQKAMTEKNSPQALMAYMKRMQAINRVDSDSLFSNIQGLEKWANTASQPVEKAILHTLVACQYTNYVRQNQWKIEKRSKIIGTAPEQIDEWSSNLFFDKVMQQSLLSLTDSTLLQKTSSVNYEPFIEQGKASAYFRHNMYDFLCRQMMENINTTFPFAEEPSIRRITDSLYTSLLDFYQRENNKPAIVLTALNRLNYLYIIRPVAPAFSVTNKKLLGLALDPYLAGLNELIATYNQLPVAAELYLAKAIYARDRQQYAEAINLLQTAIRRYPKYDRINQLKAVKENILQPRLSISFPDVAYPGAEIKVNARFANTTGFTVQYNRVEVPPAAKTPNEKPDIAFYTKNAHLDKSKNHTFQTKENPAMQDTTLLMTMPPVGLYIVEIIPNGEKKLKESQLLYVSTLKLLSRKLPNDSLELVVLNAKTGKPVQGATVSLYNSNQKDTLISNKDGRMISKQLPSDYLAVASLGKNDYLPSQYLAHRWNYSTGNDNPNQVKLLTDRNMYRPGQTVYVKGIAYATESDSAQVLANKTYTVSLYSEEGKTSLAEHRVTTNEFGSFTAQFPINQGCTPGYYELRVDNKRNNSILVQEYKLPTFEITFLPQKGSYRPGDSISIKGNATTFSGTPIQEGVVKYTFTRRPHWFWRWDNSYPTTLASGETTLTDEGEFSINTFLQPNESQTDTDAQTYVYTMEVTVTDAAGETQENVESLTVSNRSALLNSNLTDDVNKDSAFVATFSAVNASGQPLALKGAYAIRTGKDSTVVAQGTFVANESFVLQCLETLPAGAYQLLLTSKDDQQRLVEYKKTFILFSPTDHKPPIQRAKWFKMLNNTFSAEQPARFLFGSSLKDVYVMYDIFSNNQWLESKTVELNDNVISYTLPYKEKYGEEVRIYFTFVKDNEVYNETALIKKYKKPTALQMKWDVFRDKLRPGQKEEWKLTILNAEGTAAKAEMLALMYDAALDKLAPNYMGFKVYYPYKNIEYNWKADNIGYLFYNFFFPKKNFSFDQLTYDSFHLVDNRYGRTRIHDASPVIAGSKSSYRISKNSGAMEMEMASNSEVIPGTLNESVTYSKESEQPTNFRRNFSETAFFYPQLCTNSKGEVSFSFTMPETLTSWRFRSFAHTKEMHLGEMDTTVVTSKEFMVVPNLPRFVRMGDKTTITASIQNTSGKQVSGNARMQLFDPWTDRIFFDEKVPFSVEVDKSTSVTFQFTPEDDQTLIGCRIVAEGGLFSDGEQRLLPVLSNKESITESVSLPIRGEQKREFSLKELFNKQSHTATNRRLTVEFSSNPAWYAVQALPVVNNPSDESAVTWAATFYANGLASYILRSQPRLQALLDNWKVTGAGKEDFWSNLQKNQELKNILLNETPWLTEAATESEQKQRLTTLFDLNNRRDNDRKASARLQALQLPNGSWSWYKGMTGNDLITSFVISTFTQLFELTGDSLTNHEQAMYNSGMNYLCNAMTTKYNTLKKEKRMADSSTAIEAETLDFLYYRALSGMKIPEKSKEAYAYYMKRASSSIAKQSLLMNAQTAIILSKTGKAKEAEAFIQSIKEHAIRSDEMGLFFDNKTNKSNDCLINQQVMIIRAFQTVGNYESEIEAMKIWLLKQKQTQAWDSPIATVNAIYALLSGETNLLDNSNKVKLTLGKKVIETPTNPSSFERVTGYLKQTWTGKEIAHSMDRITVDNTGKGIAWGAVYAQFTEDIDKVTSIGGPVSLEKRFYVQRIVNNQKQLLPLNEKQPLTVGDKVVCRLTIRADRNMDFIQIRDQRAACMEPISSHSGYQWDSRLGYYRSIRDASTDLFFDSIKKGTYVVEQVYYITRKGEYTTGITTLQSAYTPEFSAHTSSERLTVE